MGSGIGHGSKVAVIGGGVAGSAFALSLIQTARERALAVDVRVYEGEHVLPAGPALLTPECRARMAGLGCRVEPSWRATEIEWVEVLHKDRQQRFQPARLGLWVVDGWPSVAGKRLIARSFLQRAIDAGVRVIPRRVDGVDGALPPGPVKEGRLVVRSQGVSDRFHAVAIASGVGASSAEHFLPGYQSPPTTAAAHARLCYPPFRGPSSETFKIVLSPLEGVDALFLLPARGSLFAWVVGPQASPGDLCQALMGAARDGHLSEGFEITELAAARVPIGYSKTLIGRDQVVVGAAALGSPLQLGISDALATASRAAAELLESGGAVRPLRTRYVDRGVGHLCQQASAGGRALHWLTRAGSRAPAAIASASRERRVTLPFIGGVLGLPGPSPRALLSHARWSGLRELLSTSVLSVVDPLPPSAMFAEPNLYYVVDDDPSARDALARFLESHGGRVVAFADELALYSAAARRPPSCILLDVVLNWVDGLTLCAGLKQHPLTRDVPVFVMTGLDRPHIRHRALAAGANAFFTKPIDPQLLLRHLNGHRPVAGQAVPLEVRRLAPRTPPADTRQAH